ncbi:MAG TPA: choline ABC transporter permease subunit, partial [Rhizobium sp.]
MNWLTDYRIPIGPWAKAVVDWLTTNVTWFFDGLSFLVAHVIKALLFLLQAPHPLVVVVVIAAIAYWLRRSIPVAALTLIGLLITINQGYWKETTETLALVLASTF